jgi:hypothetical protein
MALAQPKLHGRAKLALRPGLLGLAAHARSRGLPGAQRQSRPNPTACRQRVGSGWRLGLLGEVGDLLEAHREGGAHQTVAPHDGVLGQRRAGDGRRDRWLRGGARVVGEGLHFGEELVKSAVGAVRG